MLILQFILSVGKCVSVMTFGLFFRSVCKKKILILTTVVQNSLCYPTNTVMQISSLAITLSFRLTIIEPGGK